MTDYKALCAELVQALERHDLTLAEDNLLDRAATLLLSRLAPQPMPQGPTTDELHQVFHDYARDFCKEKVLSPGRFCVAARAVLAKWGNLAPQPVPEGPNDEELDEELDELAEDFMVISEDGTGFVDDHVKYARAALARWGRLVPQPEPERPTDDELRKAYAAAYYKSVDRQGPAAQVFALRTILAKWGNQ